MMKDWVAEVHFKDIYMEYARFKPVQTLSCIFYVSYWITII